MVYKVGKLISDSIDKAIQSSLRTQYPVSRKNINPSTAGHCSRRSVAQMLVAESVVEQNTIVNQAYFSVGNVLERVILDGLKDKKLLIAESLPVIRSYKSKTISGKIDGVLDIDDAIIPIEIKSCGKLPAKPRTYQLAQLMTYMVMTGSQRGILLYFSRSIADWRQQLLIKSFEVEMTPDSLLHYSTVLARSLVYANGGLLPPIPFENDKECTFCPFIPLCWEGDDKFRLPYPPAPTIITLELEVEALAERIVERQPDYNTEFLVRVKKADKF